MRAKQGSDSGFALLESVLMLVLSTFVLLLLAFTVGMVSRSSGHAAGLVNEAEQLATGLAALRRDLAGATATTVAGGQDEALLFQGSAQAIGLVSSAGGAEEIVWIEQGGDDRAGTLVRAAAPLLPAAADFSAISAARPRPLLAGPWRFRFAFASVKEGGVSWTDRWSGQRRLPDLVRLEVVSMRQPNATPLTMLVAPHVRESRRCAFDQPESCAAAQPVDPPQ